MQSNLQVGERYTFKLHDGRGKPFIGTVLELGEDHAVMKTRLKDRVEVPFGRVLKPAGERPTVQKAVSTNGNGDAGEQETPRRGLQKRVSTGRRLVDPEMVRRALNKLDEEERFALGF